MGETGVSTRSAEQERLLEREGELRMLAELIELAAAGEGRLAFVEGPAGIGKTQLLTEARNRANEGGFGLLSARGGELEREFAFGVVRQLFEPVVADGEVRARLLVGAAAPARAVFETPEGGFEAEADASFAVLHGLFWLTLNLSAERPLLLVLDDLHWCDHASLRFLAYLVRRLEGVSVLVVAGLRSADPGVDEALLGELGTDPLTVVLHPAALSGEAVEELVRQRLGEIAERAFTAACRTVTGGNPLLVSELLKALITEGVQPVAVNVGVVNELGPRAASRSVLLRLARLESDARAVACALAVLGDGADPRVVAALAGVDELQAARATDALARVEIVRADPPLGFVHPLVGDAVYHDVPPGERALLHERAVDLLVKADAPVERVAAHLLAIPPRADASPVEVLRRAGAAALKKGAPESAVAYLRRALSEPPAAETRMQVLLELGHAEALTSGPDAAGHLLEGYAALSDPVARARVAQVLAGALLFTGRPQDGAAVAREAAAALPPEQPDLRRSLEAFALGAALFGAGGYAEFPRLEDDVDLDGGVGGKMLTGLTALARAYAGEHLEQPVRLALDALAGGELVAADPSGIPTMAAILVLVFADRDEAIKRLDEALAEVHRSGSLFGIAGVRLFRGHALLKRGELAEARDELETATHDLRMWGYGPGARIYATAFLGATLVAIGDLAAARKLLPDAEEPQIVADGARFWLNSKLELLVAEGRHDEAIRVAELLRSQYGHVLLPAAGHWRSLAAEALDRLGRRDEARAHAEEELEFGRRWGAPGTVGRALRVLGTVERENGLERLGESVDVLSGSSARLELAKSLAGLGSALRRSRRPSDAREPLRRALELAELCGTPGLAEHARSELYATGARPRTTALRGPEALTASELRAATLAAEGQTNREIAQGLFVTPKTVEVHLTNAYRKLGIRSRRELPAALAAA
jgi:DNA-binding CsgD family transcriptional regulator